MPHHVPPEVTAAIADALGAPRVTLALLAGGTNRRTFRVRHAGRRWVARVEPGPALSLLRAVDAQARAHAAGVRTPVTVAHGTTPTAAGAFVWSVEDVVRGRPFPHGDPVGAQALAATADLAVQLRRLHALAVDAFGDLPPRPYAVYPDHAAWTANKARRIPRAVALAGGAPDAIPRVERVYAALGAWYDGPPRLCKGDCAGDNILVDRAGRATIVDWEWAQGLDPAADVAYWCGFSDDPRAHEALLAAYEPDDPPSFRRRVWAHRVVHCIETIHVFDEHRHAFDEHARRAGIGAAWASLGGLLAEWPA